MFFTVYWKNGSKSFIEGANIEEAFINEGHPNIVLDDYQVVKAFDASLIYDFKIGTWVASDKPDYVLFGDISRRFFDKQAQYGVRFLSKEMAAANNMPYIGYNIQVLGDFDDYHNLMIHKEDIELLVLRYRDSQRPKATL